jgi:ABC-type lipoprotein export system ATPase subunit
MYLKTILQQDNCKLVMIDQPEDNLGNTFKNEDLINLLRQYKFSKQLILVTHNPSIVVYGDAECIVLAKNNSSRISYKQLVLEKKESQKMIIDNLDGGKAIFDMRSRKYNIKKLLNS